jgi:hypothetical protein
MIEATRAVITAFKTAVVHRNVTAQIFWLKNRASDDWRVRTLHGGEVQPAITITGNSAEAEL